MYQNIVNNFYSLFAEFECTFQMGISYLTTFTTKMEYPQYHALSYYREL